jgi:propanol-preferring alcohol dehydrogenase
VVELARSGAIQSEAEVYGIEDTINAYGKLRRGDVLGRAVVVPRR